MRVLNVFDARGIELKPGVISPNRSNTLETGSTKVTENEGQIVLLGCARQEGRRTGPYSIR